ncbi:MAG TPA: hypothetical protein VMD98_04205 [Bryocella sp.]|nr:hypothetical protein [Bryocella sp.]
MSFFSNANAFQFWAIGLCMAVTVVALSLAAIFVFVAKNRPAKIDPLLRHKTEERLSELTHAATSHPANSN